MVHLKWKIKRIPCLTIVHYSYMFIPHRMHYLYTLYIQRKKKLYIWWQCCPAQHCACFCENCFVEREIQSWELIISTYLRLYIRICFVRIETFTNNEESNCRSADHRSSPELSDRSVNKSKNGTMTRDLYLSLSFRMQMIRLYNHWNESMKIWRIMYWFN